MKFTGIIKHARIIQYPGTNWARVTGRIYNDIHERFRDGTQIGTSRVVLVVGDVVYTRNSVYKVEWSPNG